jgi:hypothetical protein
LYFGQNFGDALGVVSAEPHALNQARLGHGPLRPHWLHEAKPLDDRSIEMLQFFSVNASMCGSTAATGLSPAWWSDPPAHRSDQRPDRSLAAVDAFPINLRKQPRLRAVWAFGLFLLNT